MVVDEGENENLINNRTIGYVVKWLTEENYDWKKPMMATWKTDTNIEGQCNTMESETGYSESRRQWQWPIQWKKADIVAMTEDGLKRTIVANNGPWYQWPANPATSVQLLRWLWYYWWLTNYWYRDPYWLFVVNVDGEAREGRKLIEVDDCEVMTLVWKYHCCYYC